ncbi:MAG: ATP-binding protein [Chryseobacterium taeanense]|jgi:hypothetical protein
MTTVYQDNTYITTKDLLFKGILHDIKKSKTSLQPIFEAFTNALEAIKIKAQQIPDYKGKIEIKINSVDTTVENAYEFASLSITDDGIGFNEEEFKRFNTFKDFTKGFKNLGSGRVQYAHYFDRTIVKSVFKNTEKNYEREFIVSKHDNFLDQNAIVLHKYCKESSETETGTTINFITLLENSNIYNGLNAEVLKKELLERYIHYFCHNHETLPEIEILFFVHAILKDEQSISDKDIPKFEKSEKIKVKYSKIPAKGKGIDKIDKEEVFTIDAFKIQSSILKENNLKLVSKGEIVEDSGISLQSLASKDTVKGHKYLFLVSGNYIDDRDTNLRGELNIPTKDSFTKSLNAFSNEEVLLEDIQEEVNNKINSMYPEIEEVKKEHDKQLERLKEMFNLDDQTVKDIDISINDSESKILEKFYEAEAKKTASVDASIKASIDKLELLDTRSENYNEELKKEVEKLVKTIPLQNKTSLTHYVARRKLVLDLFQKILDKKLKIQSDSETNFDEALIHNLLFQQSSTNPESSDLWIINEDFVYFKGSSEKQLSKVMIDGELLFKEKFTEEEEKYLTSLGENRKIKRPDILLFPEEGKCIIIEMKAPDVNAADHLSQIDFYANLIRNYTQDKFQITMFYGYLIGQNIESRDVLGRVSRYEHSYQFDYLFRPSENVIGFDGRSNGAIYTEVLKYTTLLSRAKQRNKIFLEKLQSLK